MKIQPIENPISFKSGYPTNPWSSMREIPDYVYTYPGYFPTDEKDGHVLHGSPFNGRHLNYFA